MNISEIEVSKVKLNKDNPRVIKDDKFRKLVESVKKFPQMLQIRPIVLNRDYMILGGNQRFKACIEAGFKKIPFYFADELTPEQEKEFIIKDNVAFGEWDWEIIREEWNVNELSGWGLDAPIMKETERLSNLNHQSIYFEPEEKPDIKLADCLDLGKFNSKVAAINEMDLTKKQKNLLRFFAYRFIKIDFESVANYYSFNATEEEKKAIERLRLVLVDNGLQGFIEDDLLRVYDAIQIEEESEGEDD
jgi:hypothetical protein